MEKNMSRLAGKFARRIESGEIVQIIGTFFDEDPERPERPETMMVVQYACACGKEHHYEIEDFILNFEIVDDVRTVSITAPRDHDDFWEAVERLASDFDVVLEDDEDIELGDEMVSGEIAQRVH